MKVNSTQILIIRILLFVLICLYSILVFGQRSAKVGPQQTTSIVARDVITIDMLKR